MRYLPLIAFLALSLLWGSEWMLTASLPSQPLLRSLAVRYGIAAVLLLPWAVRHRLWRKSFGSVLNASATGVAVLCLPSVLIAVAKAELSPVLSLMAMSAVPLLLAIFGRFAISTAVCGLAGVLFLAGSDFRVSMHQAPWLLFPLAAAGVLAWGLAHAARHLPAMSIPEGLFVQCTVAAVLLGAASPLLEPGRVTWSAMAGVGFAIAAAVTVVCGYLLFYWLLGSLGAGRVSMLQWTQLLVATAESVLLIRIRPGWESAAGAALIVIALVRGFSKGEAEQGVILKITQE